MMKIRKRENGDREEVRFRQELIPHGPRLSTSWSSLPLASCIPTVTTFDCFFSYVLDTGTEGRSTAFHQRCACGRFESAGREGVYGMECWAWSPACAWLLHLSSVEWIGWSTAWGLIQLSLLLLSFFASVGASVAYLLVGTGVVSRLEP
ncbi:hypothetical protein K402DRAFT_109028 [Aulographum hederae CBS 113979]|uniref:Uncharacterized protein n=1 Tax=Aulographum hederae CBS 113979 TaxID=1176131 RepID=A0A6G1GXH1_9PEZI|nr:hypothetical protein K402DRAFT_109028 [Aulographum hederae CBS 113979]